MTKNNLLNAALVMGRIFQIFYILAFLFITVIFVHVQVDGKFYRDKVVTFENQTIVYRATPDTNAQYMKQTLDQMSTIRRIGLYFLIYALLTSFQYYQFENFQHSGIAVSFTPLLIMLVAFIMAEVFKEGSVLLTDKELTI